MCSPNNNDFLPKAADSKPRVPDIVEVNNELLIRSIVLIFVSTIDTLFKLFNNL